MSDPMTRFRLACELSDFGAAMVESTFMRRNPTATRAEIDAAVRIWRSERPGAEHGDASGLSRPIDYLL